MHAAHRAALKAVDAKEDVGPAMIVIAPVVRRVQRGDGGGQPDGVPMLPRSGWKTTMAWEQEHGG